MGEAPSILVVGGGSAGSRHGRHLSACGAAVTIADLDRARAATAAAASGVRDDAGVVDLDQALGSRWDGVVVASPNSAHAAQTLAALATGARVLVEKPMTVTAEDASALAAAGSDRLAVAYNLRFHQPLLHLMDRVHDRAGRICSVRLWFGQWLPDWRPGTDYRSSYSARRDLGGGILLDASHELDLALWLMGGGSLEVLGALVGQVGPLQIDVEDTVAALLQGPGGIPVSVQLDYLSRTYRRGVEVVGDRATVRLDWARRVLEVEGADGSTVEDADPSVEASYLSQARAFVDWVNGGAPMPVDGVEGARSVALAQQIRNTALCQLTQPRR